MLLGKRKAPENDTSAPPSLLDAGAGGEGATPDPPSIKRLRSEEETAAIGELLSGPPVDPSHLLPVEVWYLLLKEFTPPWMWRVCSMVCKLWHAHLWPTIASLEETSEAVPNHGILFSSLVRERRWDLLHWCNRNGANKDSDACTQALRQGSFAEFKEMVRCGFPSDRYTTAQIVRMGNLPFLQKACPSLSLSIPPSAPSLCSFFFYEKIVYIYIYHW